VFRQARAVLLALPLLAAGLLAGCDLNLHFDTPVHAARTGQYYPVIRTPVAHASPTPLPLNYTLGAWPSAYATPSSGTVTIYVSFHDNAVPLAGAPAMLSVQFPTPAGLDTQSYGPIATDSAGLAAFEVAFAGLQPGTAVVVRASVTYGGQSYVATTNFATLGG
jgi:hypothetical protein